MPGEPPPSKDAVLTALIGLAGSLILSFGSLCAAAITTSLEEHNEATKQLTEQTNEELQLQEKRQDATCTTILSNLGRDSSSGETFTKPEKDLLLEGSRRCIGLLPAPNDIPSSMVGDLGAVIDRKRTQ